MFPKRAAREYMYQLLLFHLQNIIGHMVKIRKRSCLVSSQFTPCILTTLWKTWNIFTCVVQSSVKWFSTYKCEDADFLHLPSETLLTEISGSLVVHLVWTSAKWSLCTEALILGNLTFIIDFFLTLNEAEKA